jgi:hypothetical protein
MGFTVAKDGDEDGEEEEEMNFKERVDSWLRGVRVRLRVLLS